MDLKQQLEFCKKCKNKKFSDIGIVCSLTDKKPDFQNKCNDFIIDPIELQKINAKEKYSNYENEEKESNKSIWVFLGIAFVIIKIILRFMRD